MAAPTTESTTARKKGRKGKGANVHATLQEAAANLQQPGTSLTGPGIEIRDPLEVCKELCDVATRRDPIADPWPQTADGEPEEYVKALVVQEIGEALMADIIRLSHLRRFTVHYLYRNKETWESKGRTVYGRMQRPSGLLRSYSEADFIVLINWPIWQAMTPMQRVALVYHELRHGDLEGKVRGHDFEGFFDELSLFGTDTYRDWNMLAKAVSKGAEVQHQYSLDLSKLDQPAEANEDEGTDPFDPAGAAAAEYAHARATH